MGLYPDFSQYNDDLDIDALAEQGVDALKEELKRTRELYKALDTIFEDSLDGFFITDGEGNVIMVNKSYEIMSGIKKEEILGKNMRELESKLITYSASLIVLETRKTVTIEQTYLRTMRKAYITSTPVFDKDGKIIMVVSNNRDFKMIEELRKELTSQREQVTKYKKKSRRSSIKILTSQIFLSMIRKCMKFFIWQPKWRIRIQPCLFRERQEPEKKRWQILFIRTV